MGLPRSSIDAVPLVMLALGLLAGGCTGHRGAGSGGNAITASGQVPPPDRSRIVPLVDHHQHLVSPGTVAMINARRRPGSPPQEPITSDRLVALLDSAGIGRAVVLSGAFTFGGRNFDAQRHTLPPEELDARVRAEN